MLEIKPGESVCDTFSNRHVIADARLPQWAPKSLLLHSDGLHTIGILVSFHDERLTIIADWQEPGAPGGVQDAVADGDRHRIALRFVCDNLNEPDNNSD